ncbi:MAG TPA: L,D-transpeptidase family protein [Chthoniobacterales bacterium]
MRRKFSLILFVVSLAFQISIDASPADGARQLIVSIAPDWNSSKGHLQMFERDGRVWRAVSPVFPVLYGKRGLAWGSGVVGQNEPGLRKQERDGRAPAGVFRIGRIYTYDSTLPKGADFPFHTVGRYDAWPDDPNNPYYNRLVTVDPSDVPPWFDKQKMRHDDFAYRWLVEIRHNADPPVPGAGSAIFFHIRRGVQRPSSGCTTMAEADLVSLIRWLRADESPLYALLPRSEYEAKWKTWGLPDPTLFGPVGRFR